MSRLDYEIINNQKFSRREGKPGGYICYRTALSYIGRNIMNNGADPSLFGEFAVKLRQAIDNGYSYEDEYIALYYSSDSGVFILIDKTHGTIPLVFYEIPVVSDSPRIEALIKSVDDLIENSEIISNFLFDKKDMPWDEFQSDLQSLFHYKEED